MLLMSLVVITGFVVVGDGEHGKESGSSNGEEGSENAEQFELKFDPAALLHHLNSPEGKA